MTTNASFQTKVRKFIQTIDRRIHAVFNHNFFGIYEGVIEVVNDAQATLTVSVAQLNNTVFTDCRVSTPLLSVDAKIVPTFIVGTHVLIVFTEFKLSNPVIISQISPQDSIRTVLDKDNINITNGDGSITLKLNGDVLIDGNNITLTGNTITANGEDLTHDDIGVL